MVDFAKLKMTPRHEQRSHLYRCDLCGEEDWYVLRLPDHMLAGHLQNGVGRRCQGKLVWQAERLTYPEAEALPPIGGEVKK